MTSNYSGPYSSKRAELQFERADRAIDKTAQAIADEIDKLLTRGERWDAVARAYLLERLFLRLTGEHDLAGILDSLSMPGDATLKLSNALADYRNSRFVDR